MPLRVWRSDEAKPIVSAPLSSNVYLVVFLM